MEDHERRISAAKKALTLGELDRLVADLQTPDTLSPTPVTKRPRRGPLIAAAAGVAVVVAFAIGWVVFGDDGDDNQPAASEPAAASPKPEVPEVPAPRVAPSPEPEVPPQVLNVPKELHTVEGMNALFDSMRQRFGDTMGIELAIFPDEAMLYRPDPTDEKSKLMYRFRGGWGDPDRRPRDEEDGVADLAAIDVNAVVAALHGAAQTVRMDPADVSEVVVDIDHLNDPPPGALDLLVRVTGKSGGNGFIYLDSAGATKRVEYPN